MHLAGYKIPKLQVSAAELQYTSPGDLLRSAYGEPAGLGSVADDLASGAIRLLPTVEWSPETIAACEQAHMGF